MDAVERFVSIILNDNLSTETRKLRAEQQKKLLKEIRSAMIEELQEELLQNGFKKENEKSFMEKEYEKYSQQNPSDVKFSRLTEFVRQKYEIDRKLAEEEIFETTSRATSVLQKVLQEFGKLNEAKDIALGGLGLTIKKSARKKEWRDLMKPFMPWNLIIFAGISVLLLPLLILIIGALLSFGQPIFSYLAASSLGLIISYAIIFWFGYGKIKKNWVKFKLFVTTIIYSNLTGIKNKK